MFPHDIELPVLFQELLRDPDRDAEAFCRLRDQRTSGVDRLHDDQVKVIDRAVADLFLHVLLHRRGNECRIARQVHVEFNIVSGEYGDLLVFRQLRADELFKIRDRRVAVIQALRGLLLALREVTVDGELQVSLVKCRT